MGRPASSRAPSPVRKPGEVMKSLEGALAKVSAQIQEGQGLAVETFDGLRQELDGVYERLDGAFTEDAARELVETVVTRLSTRLEEAEVGNATLAASTNGPRWDDSTTNAANVPFSKARPSLPSTSSVVTTPEATSADRSFNGRSGGGTIRSTPAVLGFLSALTRI